MNSALGFLLLGLAVSFNFVVIIKKYRMKRYFDSFVDCTIFSIICFLFSGTYSALVLGTIASMFVSIYLYFSPLTFASIIPDDEDDNYDDD